MKMNQLAQTKNVDSALECVDYLLARPVTEMVGLSLWYGNPGVGKTRFAKRYAIANSQIYLRLESTSTAKTFALQLYECLCYHCSLPVGNIRGSANRIFAVCKEILSDLPNLVIFVDEIDYAFKNSQLLGSIRDIVDETSAIVILVGMQDAYKELLKANVHYFDRCNFFVEFETLDRADVKLVMQTISDITVDADTIQMLHQKTSGTLRKIVKLIHAIETIAATLDVKSVSFRDVKELFNG